MPEKYLYLRWMLTILSHVADGGLKCRRHHGQTKLANANELDNVKIVLTTYHTVSAEWRLDRFAGSSILFQVRWARIILDEGRLSCVQLSIPIRLI